MKRRYRIAILCFCLLISGIVFGTNSDILAAEKQDIKKTTSLSLSDFSITDDNNVVVLDSIYGNLELTNEKEDPVKAKYIGELSVKGGEVYRYYSRTYEHFEIITSNMNFDYKKDSEDTYYIVHIVTTSKAYETQRGIKVGMSKADIITAYGEQGKEEAGKIGYQFNNYKLQFVLNNKDKVKKIELFVDEAEKGTKINKQPVSTINYKSIECNKTYKYDVNYDGKKESFIVRSAKDKTGKNIVVTVEINGNKTQIGKTGYITNIYLIDNGDNNVGFLIGMAKKIYQGKTYVCKIDNDKVQITKTVDGDVNESILAKSFTVSQKICGVLFGDCHYVFQDGFTVKKDGDYRFKYDDPTFMEALSLKKSASFVLMKGNKVSYETKTYKKGQEFYPISTDNKSYMILETPKGTKVKVKFAKKSNKVYINNIQIDKLFTGV